MGTPEQKAHREAYASKLQNVWNAGQNGGWTSDSQLNDYLQSLGSKADSPMYKQLYSQGGYSMYGPSWDPTRNFDFQHGQNIPWQGQGESWYDPSVASNWQNTDPTQAARMNGFYNWRNENESNINSQYGGNGLVAWLRGRAASSQPNSPDMSWTGQNWGNPGGQGYMLGSLPTTTPTPSQPSPTSSSAQGMTLGSLAPAPMDTAKKNWPWDEYAPFG